MQRVYAGLLVSSLLGLVAGCRAEAPDSGKGSAGMSDGDTDESVVDTGETDEPIDTAPADTDSGDTDTAPADTDSGAEERSMVSTRSDYVEIVSDGGGKMCAIRADRTVDCWGNHSASYDRCGVARIDSPVVDLQVDCPGISWSDEDGALWYSEGGGYSRVSAWDDPSEHPASVATFSWPMPGLDGLWTNGAVCSTSFEGDLSCWADGSCVDLGDPYCVTPPEWPHDDRAFVDVVYQNDNYYRGESPCVCGLDVDGAVVCEGGESWCVSPSGDTRFVLIELGWGLTEGGAFQVFDPAWEDLYGAWSSFPVDGPFVDASCTYLQSKCCGLRSDGTVSCTQAYDSADVEFGVPPTDMTFIDFDSGLYAGCGVRSDGRVECFPSPDADQPDNGVQFPP